MPHEIDHDTVAGPGVLVEDKNYRVASGETLEYEIKPTPARDDAETSLSKPPVHKGIQELRPEPLAQDVKAAAPLREIRDRGWQRQLPISKVPGQDQQPSSRFLRPQRRLGVFNSNQVRAAGLGNESGTDYLAD